MLGRRIPQLRVCPLDLGRKIAPANLPQP